MKRSAELRDLSEQHHYGLVASRTLRLASAGEKPLTESVAGFLAEWEREIQPHFATEEDVLLPAFSGTGGEADELVARTLTEHAHMREAVARLATCPDQPDLAGEIAQALHDHIRFEERVLFPAIEQALQGPALDELGRRLREVEGPAHTCTAAEG